MNIPNAIDHAARVLCQEATGRPYDEATPEMQTIFREAAMAAYQHIEDKTGALLLTTA